MTENDSHSMSQYDCHYFDKQGVHRIFSCHAKDAFQARATVNELCANELQRITGIVKLDNFEW